MILGQRSAGAWGEAAAARTLDGLVRRLARAEPHRPALRDAANRPHVIGGAPRRLDWAGLDRAVDALAARLRGLGLATDSVVATQFALCSDALIVVLAVARAGMIAAPIPLGWGRRETAAHLRRIGARATLSAGRAGPLECADMMRFAAAEAFSVRFVLAIGGPALDGVIVLDDCLDGERAGPEIDLSRTEDAADHVVLVSAEAQADGFLAVPRSHAELTAMGTGPFLAGAPDVDSLIAATLAPDTAAGLALQLVPWLLSGGELLACPPFAPRAFAQDVVREGVTHAVVPAAAMAVLLGLPPAERRRLSHVTVLSRNSRDWDATAGLRLEGAAIDGFFAPGESGLVPVVAAAGGGLPLGAGSFATAAAKGRPLAEARIGAGGRLELRGAMVPVAAFPPGAERGPDPAWITDAEGYRDTGLTAAARGEAGMTALAAPGIVAIGGRRFPENEIRAAYAEAGGEIAPVIRADPVLGQRVAGIIGDGRAVIGLSTRLAETGLSCLCIPGGGRHLGPLPSFEPAVAERTPSRAAS